MKTRDPSVITFSCATAHRRGTEPEAGGVDWKLHSPELERLFRMTNPLRGRRSSVHELLSICYWVLGEAGSPTKTLGANRSRLAEA